MQIDFIISEHESDTLMFADRAAERMPLPGMFGGNRMATRRCAKPAHTVRQARRSEPDLRIAKALSDFTEHTIVCDMNVVERHLGMPTRRVGIDGVQHALDAKTGRIHVDEKHR